MNSIQAIFKDTKVSKQVHNAAKRVTKKGQKRELSPVDKSSTTLSSSTTKRTKTTKEQDADRTPYEIEASLSLPMASEPEEELSKIVLETNRAPLVLAFAVAVTKYTMPEQPISSRLSLAQTVVSANSRTKAVSLGIETGTGADEEGWGQGQPTIRILGREISVLKRWDYDPNEGREENQTHERLETSGSNTNNTGLPPLWGLDLESLRNKDKVDKGRLKSSTTSGLPIHTPESARSYLLKSITISNKDGDDVDEKEPTSKSPKKKKPSNSPADKERYLGLLLQALDILFSSWASTLSAEELDRRAWAWYVRVRPDVQAGVAGWGQKGKLKIADLLSLKR